jgi:hypothetical protein
MALEVTYDPETGKNSYKSDGHLVYVGPHITGHVTIADGTRYNVSPDVIEAASPEHAAQIADAVGQRFANDGHPLHTDGVPFVHIPATEV